MRRRHTIRGSVVVSALALLGCGAPDDRESRSPFTAGGVVGTDLQQAALSRAAGIAPHNRPYVYDGVQDCYGYVRQVWNAIIYDGSAHEEDFYPNGYNKSRWLGVAGGLPVNDAPSSKWAYFSDPSILLPGDVMATDQGHAWGETWHGGIYAGRSGGAHYQWDATINSYGNGAFKRPFWWGFHYYYRPTHDLLAQAPPPPPPQDIRHWVAIAIAPQGSYSLDSWGGITAHDGAPEVKASAFWDGWSIARDLALLPDASGGYVLDGFGGLHPFTLAGQPDPPAPDQFAYWKDWDIARRLVILPDGGGGYVLDGFGGIHPFRLGDAPQPPAAKDGPYWSEWDIARDLVLLPDGTGGYVLDGWGGIHPFRIGTAAAPPQPAEFAYWEGWDIARGIVLRQNGKGGYVLDGWGGVHPFRTGGAGLPPYARGTPYWEGWDVASAVGLGNDGASGALLDALGGVHHFQIN